AATTTAGPAPPRCWWTAAPTASSAAARRTKTWFARKSRSENAAGPARHSRLFAGRRPPVTSRERPVHGSSLLALGTGARAGGRRVHRGAGPGRQGAAAEAGPAAGRRPAALRRGLPAVLQE